MGADPQNTDGSRPLLTHPSLSGDVFQLRNIIPNISTHQSARYKYNYDLQRSRLPLPPGPLGVLKRPLGAGEGWDGERSLMGRTWDHPHPQPKPTPHTPAKATAQLPSPEKLLGLILGGFSFSKPCLSRRGSTATPPAARGPVRREGRGKGRAQRAPWHARQSWRQFCIPRHLR